MVDHLSIFNVEAASMLNCVGFWLRDAVASCECWATGRLMGTTYMESLIRAPCMEHLYNGILSTSYVSHRLESMHGTDVHISAWDPQKILHVTCSLL